MPEISRFYGIKIYMYYKDDIEHHRPHIHVKYGKLKMGIACDNGEVLYGDLPESSMKKVEEWVKIHQKELMEDWQLAVNGKRPFKIEPMR